MLRVPWLPVIMFLNKTMGRFGRSGRSFHLWTAQPGRRVSNQYRYILLPPRCRCQGKTVRDCSKGATGAGLLTMRQKDRNIRFLSLLASGGCLPARRFGIPSIGWPPLRQTPTTNLQVKREQLPQPACGYRRVPQCRRKQHLQGPHLIPVYPVLCLAYFFHRTKVQPLRAPITAHAPPRKPS